MSENIASQAPIAAARPLSPHLQIYKPQMSTVSSILHRITGVALMTGSLALVAWIWAVAYSPACLEMIHTFFQSVPGLILLVGWSAAFFYHFCNGIRHLAWDAGYGFEIKTSIATGWTVMVLTALLTAITWAWVFGLLGGVS
jgi:succinate dehydrogenase / fumarate reductase cytochrome b subunit